MKPAPFSSISDLDLVTFRFAANNLFYVLSSIQDLPSELQKKLLAAGVTLEECNANLSCTLSLLHFLYKRRFKLKPKNDSLKDLAKESEAGDGEAFESAVHAEVLDGPDQPAGTASPNNSVQQAPSNEITVDDLAREARSITEGDPLSLFTKFVSHGQGCVDFFHWILLN